ncbi:Crp/Fnr family transcriptional regulator [Anaerosporobacter sp.]|uniref:Crp/Fnr family transcriptional regulator n=1 Tax=Anaerosporobacter sp. TaxID=1872529 RepID=UPI00286EB74E|nr:cyclic nucleotide-binding domain-containing protein [Anaerosporobacter sp.]
MNIDILKKNGKICVFKKDEIICHEDETGKYVYLLLKGEAGIYKKLGGNQAGKYIAKIPEGAVFGESALIDGRKRSASIITAMDNTIVLEFEKQTYLKLLKKETELAFKLLKTLMYRIDLAMDQLIALDPAYVFACRTHDIYKVVLSLDTKTFKEIIDGNSEYSITALKELSEMLDSLNQRILS